jgi:hypothetical protein
MKKIIIPIIFLAVAGVLIWLGYPIIKQRYFTDDTQQPVKNELKNNHEKSSEPETTTQPEQDSSTDSNEPSANQEQLPQNEGNPDCDSECSSYVNNSQKLEYCRQVCGLVSIEKKNDASDCETLTGLKKDYCFKDLAVTKMDFRICDSITDKNIKKTCTNRVAEDISNSSN